MNSKEKGNTPQDSKQPSRRRFLTQGAALAGLAAVGGTTLARAQGQDPTQRTDFVPEDQVPAEVRELRRWAADGVPLSHLSAARAECLAGLKEEYLQ